MTRRPVLMPLPALPTPRREERRFDGELAAGGEATTQVLWQLSTPFDGVVGGAGVGYVAEVESATGTTRITLPVSWD